MKHAFAQGHLDSLCGVYSIVNAEKLINNSSSEESQQLFNDIILYLSRKRILKDIILEGSNHFWISKIMRDVIGDRIPVKVANRRNFKNLNEWWKYSKEFLEQETDRAIILSIGGKRCHLTTIQQITDKRMLLQDSAGIIYIKKSDCRLSNNYVEDKYIIYPSQCFYLAKEQ